MSLNNGNAKAPTRAEIAKLIDEYFENGGRVTKKPGEGKVTITCPVCHRRQHVSVHFAMHFGKTCSRCGSPTTIAWS